MPNNTNKANNFIRLAEARTNKIINMIELLGNLSNKSNYSYSQEQIEAIFNSIEESLNRTKKLFNEERVVQKKKFRL